MDLFRKFGVKKSTAKPGDLIMAAKTHKFHKKHKMTQAEDNAYDRAHHQVEGSKADLAQDRREGIKDKKHRKHHKLERMNIDRGEAADEERTLKLKKGKMCKKCGKRHSVGLKHKNWIANAIKKPGALRRTLGAKSGHKIPTGKLAAAANKKGVTGKRARLARTLRSFH